MHSPSDVGRQGLWLEAHKQLPSYHVIGRIMHTAMPHGLAGHCSSSAASRQYQYLHPHGRNIAYLVRPAVTKCNMLSRSSTPCTLSSSSSSSTGSRPAPECCRTHSQQSWTGTSSSSGRRRRSCLARGILDTYRQEQAAVNKEAGENEPPCTVECVKDIYCGELPCLPLKQQEHACHCTPPTGHEHGWAGPSSKQTNSLCKPQGPSAMERSTRPAGSTACIYGCAVADLDRELEEAGDKTLVVVEWVSVRPVFPHTILQGLGSH